MIYRGLVLVMLGLIAHQLTDQQITADIRKNEFNKATNFCNGGTGRLSWSN